MGKSQGQKEGTVAAHVLVNTCYVTVWIALSGTVILSNKWILAYYGFPYPITLTMWHMAFSGGLAFLIIRGGYVAPADGINAQVYLRAIVPIAALFSGTLWLGNAAYMYLSVSFIQMLKALMPVAVFGVGCGFGVEAFSWSSLANMIVVTIGVAIASYGEINFVLMGVILQLLSVMVESTRLLLVQILLQHRGLTLNPITTMYYIAPASFLFLCVPWSFIEAVPLLSDPNVHLNAPIFILNAAAAFGLNMSVFLLIGKTSALTMNIAGVIKDWLLIGMSVLLFQAIVTSINLGGYLIAFLGVCWYNYKKVLAMQQRQAAQQAAQSLTIADKEKSLLGKEGPEKEQPSPNTISISAKARGQGQSVTSAP